MKRHSAALIVLSLCCAVARTYASECEVNPYFTAVDKIVNAAVGSDSELGLTIFPSFEAEYGVRVAGDVVYLVQMRKGFWASSIVQDSRGRYHHNFSSTSVGTSVYKSSLSPAVADRVKQIYSSTIERSALSQSIGLDGTTYQFAISHGGCGRTWSPAAGSYDGELVELAELLAAHAKATTSFSHRRSEKKILEKLSELEQRAPKPK